MWGCIARSPPFLHYSAQDSPSHTASLQVIPLLFLPIQLSPGNCKGQGLKHSLSPGAVKVSLTHSLGASIGTKLWGLQRDFTLLLLQTNSHADVKISLPHNWAGQGLRWWRSSILFINCYCLSSGNASDSLFLTSIYILALSKGWSNIDSGYKSHQHVNKCTVCGRKFMRGKKVCLEKD